MALLLEVLQKSEKTYALDRGSFMFLLKYKQPKVKSLRKKQQWQI